MQSLVTNETLWDGSYRFSNRSLQTVTNERKKEENKRQTEGIEITCARVPF